MLLSLVKVSLLPPARHRPRANAKSRKKKRDKNQARPRRPQALVWPTGRLPRCGWRGLAPSALKTAKPQNRNCLKYSSIVCTDFVRTYMPEVVRFARFAASRSRLKLIYFCCTIKTSSRVSR